VLNVGSSLPISVRVYDVGMPCTSSCAEAESRWTVVTPGIRCRNWVILLLSEVTFTVSMVVNMRWFAGLHCTSWMSVALRAVLVLSLLVITEVLRREPSLLLMSLHSLRLGPFLVEGALVVGWGGAAAGADVAEGSVLFFLGFFATCPHEGMAVWVVQVLG
jgi:hypothetical protein